MHTKNRMKHLILLTLAFVLTVTSVSAQWADNSPEAVAQEYLQALKQNSWMSIAELLHPEALASFKEIFVEVSEVDTSDVIASLLFGEGATKADLSNAHPKQVYLGFMRLANESEPSMQWFNISMESTVIGHVAESDSIVHVLYRIKNRLMGTDFSEVSVSSFALYEDSWMLLMSGDISNMAEALKSQILESATEGAH